MRKTKKITKQRSKLWYSELYEMVRITYPSGRVETLPLETDQSWHETSICEWYMQDVNKAAKKNGRKPIYEFVSYL